MFNDHLKVSSLEREIHVLGIWKNFHSTNLRQVFRKKNRKAASTLAEPLNLNILAPVDAMHPLEFHRPKQRWLMRVEPSEWNLNGKPKLTFFRFSSRERDASRMEQNKNMFNRLIGDNLLFFSEFIKRNRAFDE